MPKPKLPHLNHERDRHGKMRWYVRVRHGRRTPIHGAFGSAQFLEEYKAAVLQTPHAPPSAKASRGTLAWLVASWKEHSDWQRTAPATQRQRENILKHVLEKAGGRDYGDITRADIRRGREDRKATPSAANNFLKTMRALFNWALAEELIDENPALGVPLFPKTKDGGFPTWSVDDVQTYRDKYPLGTRERLVMEIALNTGLRRSDIVRVGGVHVHNGVIDIKTAKTGVQLYVPVLPRLQEAIDAMPPRPIWVCSERNGKPIAKESLGTMFREWCNAASVSKRLHGLRKLCATVIADEGASELELQALFGWITNNQSAVYTREANKRRLAMQAAIRLMEAEGFGDDDEEDEKGTVAEQGALTFESTCPNPKKTAA